MHSPVAFLLLSAFIVCSVKSEGQNKNGDIHWQTEPFDRTSLEKQITHARPRHDGGHKVNSQPRCFMNPDQQDSVDTKPSIVDGIPHDAVVLNDNKAGIIPRDTDYIRINQFPDGQLNFGTSRIPGAPLIPPTDQLSAASASTDVPTAIPPTQETPETTEPPVAPAIPETPVSGDPAPTKQADPSVYTSCQDRVEVTTVTTVLTLTFNDCTTFGLNKRDSTPTGSALSGLVSAGLTTEVPMAEIEDDPIVRRNALIQGSGSRVRVLGFIWVAVCLTLGGALFITA
ncbi:hypothetical protein FN846DRAFT_916854 [Sphaerosporella brunnea]|uniref:Mid2 domain-containing protein n=1 Tax=Sphaerosporella brunnea TaxID=1250544 RepID=A0A5J5F5W6_9PEZI|nr:hypothetical protein FN846DRAFT_916854 [Sphaerosporella brunnea]